MGVFLGPVIIIIIKYIIYHNINPNCYQENVMKGFSDAMASAAARDLKLCKKQARYPSFLIFS